MGNYYSPIKKDDEHLEILRFNPKWKEHQILYRPSSHDELYPLFNRISDTFLKRLLKNSKKQFNYTNMNTYLFICYNQQYFYVYFLRLGVLFYYTNIYNTNTWKNLYLYCDHPGIIHPDIEYLDQFP